MKLKTIVETVRIYWPILLAALFWGAVGIVGPADRVSGHPLLERFLRETYLGHDFIAIYAGGVCSFEERWGDLYAEFTSKGEVEQSEWMMSALAGRHANVAPEAKSYGPAWLWPPPAAVLFFPMALFDYPEARRIWFLASWSTFVLFLVLIRRDMSKRSGFPMDLLFLGLGFGAPTVKMFNGQNLGPFFALSIWFALRSIRRGGDLLPASGMLFMGVTKAFSAVWIPLLVLWKRWRLLVCLTVFSGTLVALAAVMGCRWGDYESFLENYVSIGKRAAFHPNAAGDGIVASAVSLATSMSGRVAIRACSMLVLAAGCIWVFLLNLRVFRIPVREKARFCELSMFVSFLLYQSTAVPVWCFYRVHLFAFLPLLLDVARKHRDIAWLFFAGLALLLLVPTNNPFVFLPVDKTHAGILAYTSWTAFGALALHDEWRVLLRKRGNAIRFWDNRKT